MTFPSHGTLSVLAAVPLFFAGAVEAETIRTVGPGQTYTTIAAAVADAQDGDTINVFAGTYVNDFAEIGAKISLVAIGGQVTMIAAGLIPNGKGILITDTDITITGFSFQGAKVADANGAGIRYQSGNLVLNDCFFANNENGLLSNPDPAGTITINDSEFYHNGATTGPGAGYTHNLYVGDIAVLDIENSFIHGAHIGHQIKSRAETTIVRGSRIGDGPIGTGSYSIDLPNGGNALIENNRIRQGAASQNPNMIAFGEEGGVHDGSALVVSGNTIENDLSSVSARAVWNATDVEATVISNSVYGLIDAQMLLGPGTVSLTTFLFQKPPISQAHPWRK